MRILRQKPRPRRLAGRLDASATCGTRAGSAARLVRGGVVTGHERTAQTLAPRLSELLRETDWPAGVDSTWWWSPVGPGSFTGLRIGVTTAKTFAYAVGAEVIGVNTLAVIAEQAPRAAAPLWVVMDAQRQELFAAQV